MDPGVVMALITIDSLHLGVAILATYWTFCGQRWPPPPQVKQQEMITGPNPIDAHYEQLIQFSTRGLNLIRILGNHPQVTDKRTRDLVNIDIPEWIQRQVQLNFHEGQYIYW